ncbi:MAG TPA: hypothetical protein VJV75_13115 [Candidatus Polarisedimenticolia bacterium]|nr:hypothetical protein [Candidatus Polarisedimenticolia bacterium]
MPRRPRFPGYTASALLLTAACVALGVPVAVHAATPGEATDLQVTGYDPATGNLSISWTSGCGAADHHIEYGLLQDMSTYGYSGQTCGLGTGGSYASFHPGEGSYFFFVVADDGVGVEGSYGRSLIDGVSQERPEDTLDPACSRVQDLSQRCDGPFNPVVDLTAYRPVIGSSGASGAPFQRWPVGESEEVTPGAGIRVDGDDDDADGIPDRDDSGVVGENDLVELTLTVDPPTPPPGYEYALVRSGPQLRAWTASIHGSEIFGAGDFVSLALPSGALTLWAESPNGLEADLHLVARRLATGMLVAMDTVHFVPFTSVVIALGGENQVPGDPTLDPGNHGAFELAITLYRMGYDVHMYDEDVVPASGAGAAYNEVVGAIQRRGVTQVAVFGYSHGGGSTNDLVRRLDANRASIGTFSVAFTAYVDGIDNDSDIDIDTETALPPTTAYHANYYEHPGCGFLQLCGGPITGANLNVNVTAQPWGSSLTHFTIDDASQVLQGILDLLVTHVAH